MNTQSQEALFREAILALTEQPQTPELLAKKLNKRGVRIPHKQLTALLTDLVNEGLLLRARGSRYARPEYYHCQTGTFCSTGRSYNFVTPDSGGADLFIPPHRDGGAWNGDRVLVHQLETHSHRRGASHPEEGRTEAEVYRILSENRDTRNGCLSLRGKMVVFHADSGHYPDIVISKKHLNGAQVGDRVAVQITFRGSDKYLPQGVVTKVFGSGATMESAIASILHENDVPDSFTPQAAEQARRIPSSVSDADCVGRLDLRELVTFTIDGDTAKDFDDAVSLESLPNGRVRLGVHIADVSHYVQTGSPLDKEAFQRGNSVYYPGHVVPMLPFELSNGICSLNPHVDRLAFSVLMELGTDGQRYQVAFHRSVIRSHARLTYNQVNAALTGDQTRRSELGDLVPILEQMNRLALTLHRLRLARGALELDIPECEIRCDENNHVTEIGSRERGLGEHLIEEFMLIANETVAEHLNRTGSAAVYRVHEQPDPKKLREFAQEARLFGYRLHDDELLKDTHALQNLLDRIHGKEGQQALPSLLLRAMARARYSPDNLGHYGLAAKYYLHFTSPIRRYPDLMVHRMLAKQLAGRQSTAEDRTACSDAALQSTAREQAADDCERRIDKLYQAEYLSHYIGQTFSGYVSGVTNFGVFVCLENQIEGLVRLDSMENDWFEYDPTRMTLVGKRSGKRYYLGLPVTITVANASPTSGQIDFLFTEE